MWAIHEQSHFINNPQVITGEIIPSHGRLPGGNPTRCRPRKSNWGWKTTAVAASASWASLCCCRRAAFLPQMGQHGAWKMTLMSGGIHILTYHWVYCADNIQLGLSSVSVYPHVWASHNSIIGKVIKRTSYFWYFVFRQPRIMNKFLQSTSHIPFFTRSLGCGMHQ